MEVTVEVRFSYTAPGVDQLVKSMDLMTKFKGDNSENFSYIQQVTGSDLQADAQWSGIQDGVTFTVKNKTFSRVKEAAELLMKMVDSVLDTMKSNLSDMKIPSSAMNEVHEISSVKCGICNRSHKSTLQEFEKHVDSHNTTPKDIDIKQIVKSLAKTDAADSSLSSGADSEYRQLPFDRKATKSEREDIKPFGSFTSSIKESKWDSLWESDKKDKNGSSIRSRQRDRRSRSRSRSRERRLNRSRSRDRGRARSRSRERPQKWSSEKKRTHSPSSSFDKKRRPGFVDDGSERRDSSLSQNFLYNDVSDEMIENAHVNEPPYVATARLQILSEQRENGQLQDTECRMLLDNFIWSLSQIDKTFVSGLSQSEERAARQRGMRLSRTDTLTIELKAVCKFFISRSEQGGLNSMDKYPFAFQMKEGSGNYKRTKSARISSKGPKPSPKKTEKPKEDEKRGLSQEEIENCDNREPLYKSLRRRTILEQERSDGILSDTKMRQIIFKLRSIGNEAKQRMYTGRRIEKMNIPTYGRPTESQRLEAELFGLCDMIVDRNQGGESGSEKSASKVDYTKTAQTSPFMSSVSDSNSSVAPPWLSQQDSSLVPAAVNPFNGSSVRPSVADKSSAGGIDTTHRIMMRPHPAEPEHISQGRLKKMMADRRSGNLDNRKLEAVLKEMRECIPEEHKDRISKSLNDEMRRMGTSFLSMTKAEQLDSLLKNTCIYYLRKSAVERQMAGPYPLAHLLSQVDDPYFQSGADTTKRPVQAVEKTDEFAYSDLSEFFIRNPCASEPEVVSQGRFKKLEGHFKSTTLSALRPNAEETANIAREIKSALGQKDKDAISQSFTRMLQQTHHGGSGSSESLQLKAICEYFLKLTSEEREKYGPYPHAHLLNKYIRNRPDSQLRGTSRNGQYSSRYAEFFKKLDIVKRVVAVLAEQNNVSYEFNVTTTSKSQYQATVTVGNTEFKETSTISAYQATSMAIYQALMKTEYAFHKIPDGLRDHRPNETASKVIVRSTEPSNAARMLVKVLEQQSDQTIRYTLKSEPFCCAVQAHFGNQKFTGIGKTEEAAKAMADFYCIQQTSFSYKEVPPGVAIGHSGERFRVVEAPYAAVVSRRRDYQDGTDRVMTNEFTWLVISELEQKTKLSTEDKSLVNKKIELLAKTAPTTSDWKDQWKTLAVTKKLEYTCDLATKRENNSNFIVGKWIGEARFDQDVRRGRTEARSTERVPWARTESLNTERTPWSRAEPMDTEETPWKRSQTVNTEKTPWGRSGAGDTEKTPWGRSVTENVEKTPWGRDEPVPTEKTPWGRTKTADTGRAPWLRSEAPSVAGTTRLPWIPQLEPSSEILRAPVQERLTAMKNKISELMIKRKRNTIPDHMVLGMIEEMRKMLPNEMAMEANLRLAKATRTMANQAIDNPQSMMLTMKLSVFTHYLLEVLEKQMSSGGSAGPAMPSIGASAPYNMSMRY